jgi:hypothetical protein
MLDLTPIKERCEKATAGEWIPAELHLEVSKGIKGWEIWGDPSSGAFNKFVSLAVSGDTPIWPSNSGDTPIWPSKKQAKHNRDFISAARTDIPALIEEVERLRKDIINLIKLTGVCPESYLEHVK